MAGHIASFARVFFGRKAKLRRAGGRRAGSHALAETLEPRVLLTTFTAHMTAAFAGSLSSYAVNLYVTGGIANQWVVYWGDGTSNTYTKLQQPNQKFAVPFTPQGHDYMGVAPTSPIYAVATSTASAVSTTGFALDSNFGTQPYQQGGGKVLDTPYQGSGNMPGNAMVVDASTSPPTEDVYVATPYRLSGSASTYFAVTRYLPPSQTTIGGSRDTTGWGNEQGTLELPAFGSDAETDIPLAMILVPQPNNEAPILYIAGKSTTSAGTKWAVAEVDTGGNLGKGSSPWRVSSALPTGQANALMKEDSDEGELAVVGQHNGEMTAIELDTAGNLVTGFGTSGVESVNTGGTSSTATSIVETSTDKWIMGGTTSYCTTISEPCAGCTCTFIGPASDFTMVELDDDMTNGAPVSTFGNQGSSYPGVFRFNIGSHIGISGGAQYVPSQDSANALLYWEDSSANYHLIPVGATNAIGGVQKFGLARFLDNSPNAPTLDTGFGNHTGAEVDANGTAYSAMLYNNTANTSDPNNGKIIAAGTYNNDFEVARFTNTLSGGGVLDIGSSGHPGFGYQGIFESDFGAADGSANTTDAALSLGMETYTDANGNFVPEIVVCGYSSTPTTNQQIALADYLPNNDPLLT